MRRIVVAGALANRPGNSGGACVRIDWVKGLSRLGFEVLFLEQATSELLGDASSASAANASSALQWFRGVTREAAVDERCALLIEGGPAAAGMPRRDVERFVDSAEILVNLGGHLRDEALLERFPRRAYVDLDPGFTQFWHLTGESGLGLEDHDVHFTVGENIGDERCSIPRAGFSWIPTRQPVILDDTLFAPDRGERAFTTVGTWRGPFGPVQYGGVTYGLKLHEFRKVLALPGRTAGDFVLAMAIHPADRSDRANLLREGWALVDPRHVASTPTEYKHFIGGSGAEFSAAQGMYVSTRSGWFSDRSARYLASGKPVLVQDTGVGDRIPTGEGLLTYRTLDEAAEGVDRILTDYARHRRAARNLAEDCFDSDQVLSRFLMQADVDPHTGRSVAKVGQGRSRVASA